MNNIAERKFVNLRKRLDQLGYRQPLGIESLPLVEKLFSDLVHTTESLRNAKLSAGKTEKESRNFDALLEPYRAENARVIRENNELHQELLKLKEDKDRVTRELKTHIRKLDHETSDLKFLNNQYVHKVRCLEKDSKAKAERIQQLQEKNMQAVVQTPGGKKRSIPFRRQRMQIDELIPPSSTSAYPVSQPNDPYIADLLQLADGRIHELQEDIIKVKLDLENAEECIKHLNIQYCDMLNRDKEVERLNRALQGGRPHDVISLEAQNISNEKLIAHLNLQIEYLQETNRTLEERVEGLQQKKKDASTEVANLSLKNLELCEELTHIDDLAKRLEMDKERVLETADMELQETKEQSEGDYEKDRLRDQLVELKEQNEKMEGLVNFLEEEKIRLQNKMEKMMAADKDLVLELETMRAKHGVCGRERSPSRLDAFVKSLEEERDYYRHEAERYKRARGSGGLDLSPSRSPSRGRSPCVAETELLRLTKERDDLRAALLDFERHMEDIQDNVKALSTERDHFKMLFKQVSLRNTIPPGGNYLFYISEDQILDLRSQVCLLKENREAVEDELKVRSAAVVQNAEEFAQQRAECNALRFVLTKCKMNHDYETVMCNVHLQYPRTLLSLSLRMASLFHFRKVLSCTFRTGKDQLRCHCVRGLRNVSLSVCRLLQEQMEQSLSDTQHRLSVKMNELHAAHVQIEKLEERIGELSQQGSKHNEEVAVLQKSISAMDREKDALQDEVDQKTEKLVVLQEENSKKEKTLEDVRLTVTNMDKSREREITSLRRQLDACQDELAALRRDKEITIRENRRLQDDLATMTRENQAVHVEMEEALHEKDELKLRVHSYISEVSRIEKLMATKEQENRDLLDRFRMAHSEVEEREQKLQQAEGLNNSIRLELLSSDTERRHLRDTISHQEREIQQHMQALQAYEAQVSSLVRGMSRLEEELNKAQEDKATLLSDLASVRELCVKLDSSKELTARQLTSRSMDLERVTGELEDVRSEAELLKKQLASERLTVRNLETLLSSNRHKEFQTHLTASERESELKVLRDRLTLADSKTAEHAREVSQLRGKVSQLQTEMDILKRQLTSERFERERAVQEMRRQGVSFSSMQSSLPLSVSPERSILRSLNRSSDKSADRSVSFKD
uniref:Centrosomal protein of 135 kDa n=1 Tax=Dicentrarchus labrax TaxID=13489 RepID=A0A8C4EZM8_DICLA